jgi:hypothetical protein
MASPICSSDVHMRSLYLVSYRDVLDSQELSLAMCYRDVLVMQWENKKATSGYLMAW